ncbi:MAG: GntR family transcriptional regulator [Nevskia sp.]|nr:GntR family transcriptional regulator [Nevskia sp.]
MSKPSAQLKPPERSPATALAERFPHLQDRALAYLKGLLLDGGLEPGDVISTEEVARTLGVSRAPATDAIKRLTADGFFVVMPQIGCRVPTPQEHEVADFYELFAAGEAIIARLAAQRRTPEQAAEFRWLVRDIEERNARLGAAAHAGPACRAANRLRHQAIHRFADSPIAADIAAGMWDRSDFYIRLAFGSFVVHDKARAAQKRIAEAIIAGDGRTAEKITRDYLFATGQAAARRIRRNLGRDTAA